MRSLCLVALLPCCAALAVPQAVLKLRQAHANAQQRIVSALDLVPTDRAARVLEDVDAATLPAVSNFEPKVDATDPVVSSVATCATRDAEAEARFELVAWNGPLTTVPHLQAKLSVFEGQISICLDFVPRLDGGYFDMADGEGYRDPASRAEFAQAATRSDYDARYFTADARAARFEALRGAVSTKPVPQHRVASRIGAGAKGAAAGSMVAGPLFLDATFALDDTQKAVEAFDAAVDRWLGWLASATTKTSDAASWMTSRLVYDRDCLVRADAFGRSVEDYRQLYGEDAGWALAAAVGGRSQMVGHNSLGLGRDD
ncbi:hypothetical protein M885DRAFT_510675 [Pelagophyceae sp. CCMP2097]|nr:hypothetical protein M885DRAFT_510675 [Pelagophyceae sp. CCMP2097]|mmetsp:Transcript_29899/g.100745  ORF Transcript_29899/g.100745 Transcript_29899/m.100745 type:complete len:315 (+) Transcript_29899:115-1059(+)